MHKIAETDRKMGQGKSFGDFVPGLSSAPGRKHSETWTPLLPDVQCKPHFRILLNAAWVLLDLDLCVGVQKVKSWISVEIFCGNRTFLQPQAYSRGVVGPWTIHERAVRSRNSFEFPQVATETNTLVRHVVDGSIGGDSGQRGREKLRGVYSVVGDDIGHPQVLCVHRVWALPVQGRFDPADAAHGRDLHLAPDGVHFSYGGQSQGHDDLHRVVDRRYYVRTSALQHPLNIYLPLRGG